MHDADWRRVTVHMLDFEGSAASGVVEYGIVTLRAGVVAEVETALCRPSGEIPEQDRMVHGLEARDTVGRPPFAALYGRFVALRRTGILAAHNRHAENAFLKAAWPLPPAVPDWRGGAGTAQEWGPWIDTLAIYRAVYPGLASYALGDLVDRFACGEELAELARRHCPPQRARPHCALHDALASALLLVRLEREPELAGRIRLGWLLQRSEARAPQPELF